MPKKPKVEKKKRVYGAPRKKPKPTGDMVTRVFESDYGDFTVKLRENTSDENAFKEVVDGRCYRRGSVKFDVEEGEHWLDLGGNVGAFAVYCMINGATAECYEPNPENFKLLQANAPDFVCHNAAVTASKDKHLKFWRAKSSNYRDSIHKLRGAVEEVYDNIYAGKLAKRFFDGIKMDIEGSEFDLIEQGLIPKCNKLVLEYHSSRDKSCQNLIERVETLRDMFDEIAYCKELQDIMDSGEDKKPFYDRVIYCWNVPED